MASRIYIQSRSAWKSFKKTYTMFLPALGVFALTYLIARTEKLRSKCLKNELKVNVREVTSNKWFKSLAPLAWTG